MASLPNRFQIAAADPYVRREESPPAVETRPACPGSGDIVDCKRFEPRILAFICNWCAYGAADLAGVSRLQYPPNLRAIRVMCSATVSPHHILRALQEGADGVLVGG